MIKDTVCEYIAEMVGFDSAKQVRMSHSFDEDLGMDDIELAELCENLESELEVDLSAYSGQFQTVKELVDFIIEAE